MADPFAPVDYRALFHALPGAFLLLAADGTIVDNSDQHVAVSLLPREQAVGRDIFDAYPSAPESQRDLAASHEQVRRTLRPDAMPLLRYDLERPAELGGGTEERYWQITHYPLLDAQGQLQYILLNPQDVTDATLAARRSAQVQRDLDEVTERNQFIMQSLPMMVWTTRPDGSADSFNARWTGFTGRALADTLGWGWAEDLHPDDLPRTTLLWQSARDQGVAYQAEYRMRRHDGSYRWHLASGVPRLGADGQIQMWVGCNTDIHEQKLMVEELLEANEQQAVLSDQAYEQFRKAENQRETYQALFQQAPAMIAITRGPEHRYEFVNPAYQQLFPHRQLVGRTVLEAVPEVEPQGFIQILEQVYRTGETFRGDEFKVQLERDASGVLHDAYFNFIYQQYRENDQPAGLLAFAFEVTDLVLARQALEKVRNDAAQALGDASAG